MYDKKNTIESKSIAKAAARNRKVIKNYSESKKDRIDRLLSTSNKRSKSSDRKKVSKSEHVEYDKQNNTATNVNSNTDDSMKIFLNNMKEKDREFYCTVEEFEKRVYEVEHIHVILRASKISKVRKYPYSRKCSNDTPISKFIQNRIKRNIDSMYDIEVVDKILNKDCTIGDIRRK